MCHVSKCSGVGRPRAEKWREDALACLKRLFENKAQFSCIAKDENSSNNGNKSTLMLKGFVHLNSPCTRGYLKGLLGKCSSCKPSYFGDMVSLCRFVHVDRDLTVTGRLPAHRGNSIKKFKSFTGDPKFIVKILLDSIDKKDFSKGQHKEDLELNI